MKSVARLAVGLFAVLFGAVGLGYWIVPGRVAQQFGLEAVRPAGLVTLRADLGGLFLGVALLCAAGAWAQRQDRLAAAAILLAVVVVGRLVGAVVGDGLSVRDLAVELAALAALGLYAQSLAAPSPPAADAQRR